MNPDAAASNQSPIRSYRVAAAVGLLAAALIAYEVVLMRRLIVERWHHFGFLVISLALLGFGASGTMLAILQDRVRRRPAIVTSALTFCLAWALLVMPRLATLIPITARFIPADLYSQVGWWSLYWLTAFVPFLLGGAVLGAALMTAGRHMGTTYATNLAGSAGGAVAAIWLLSRAPLEQTAWPPVALVVLAGMLLPAPSARRRLILGILMVGLTFSAELSWPLPPRYDEHKYAAYVQRLAAQAAARRVAARADPHGYVELYEGDRFHDLPFLSLKRRPPAMYSLLINGDLAASVLRIERVEQASVLDDTLLALPYRLLPPRPRVLLLGEGGGANIWLARRQGAVRIDLVQPNAAVVALWRQFAPAMLADATVEIHTTDWRRYVARAAPAMYDLVQVVALEGMAVGNAGLRGLAEDHLATVEGCAAALRLLSSDGVLAISRGIQSPPRDNIRLLATLVEALEYLGVDRPERHIVQMRDYLGACTLALKMPLDDHRRQCLRAAQEELHLTPVWYDGLAPDEVNRPDALDGPPGASSDWLHYAAREIFSPRRRTFYNDYLWNIRPARDDRPFFWDFYKPAAVATLRRAYADLWLTRVEIGRLFLYTSLLISGLAAVLFILLPLMVSMRPRARPARSWSWVLFSGAYFGGIGLGFMGLEMAFISRATRHLGDAVMASAVVIGGVLLLSGAGSLAARRLVGGRLWVAPLSVAILAASLSAVLYWAGGRAETWVLVLGGAGAAFLMGMPMPLGLTCLDRSNTHLVPWAWGINGAASVIATSAAVLSAMTIGYTAVVLLAAGSYALAGAAALFIPNLARRTSSQVQDESYADTHGHQGTK